MEIEDEKSEVLCESCKAEVNQQRNAAKAQAVTCECFYIGGTSNRGWPQTSPRPPAAYRPSPHGAAHGQPHDSHIPYPQPPSSVELRNGILYSGCQCLKRDGLQEANMMRREEDLQVKKLTDFLHNTRATSISLPGYDNTIFQEPYKIGVCDEVCPNIYIGDAISAKNKEYLKKIGITHVVNAAEGKLIDSVDTGQDYYSDSKIKYFGFVMEDVAHYNISQYFYKVADFIENALKGGGKVVVHCFKGISRSSACVLAYLMIKQGMTVAEALRQVRKHRNIRPNDGFLRQLVQLENKLKRSYTEK